MNENYVGMRIDKFLILKMEDLSRSYAHKLIDENLVTLNGKNVSKSHIIEKNQEVCITIPEAVSYKVFSQDIPLDIAYEDDDLLVVNKSKGMVVHPAAGNYEGTLVNALLHHCKDSLSGINGVMRPGIVHRIDKNTSGLLIVAKTDAAHKSLAEQIKNHTFTREYEAVVHGVLKNDKGTIATQVGRHKTERKKMAVLRVGGRRAITHYEVICRYDKFTHVKLKLETGRTHQIRVHMANIGHSVVGDSIYGHKKNEFPFLHGQCLHAKKIGFIHSVTDEYLEITSELPNYFTELINCLN